MRKLEALALQIEALQTILDLNKQINGVSEPKIYPYLKGSPAWRGIFTVEKVHLGKSMNLDNFEGFKVFGGIPEVDIFSQKVEIKSII